MLSEIETAFGSGLPVVEKKAKLVLAKCADYMKKYFLIRKNQRVSLNKIGGEKNERPRGGVFALLRAEK